MIPPFEPNSGNLPPDVHEADWGEFEQRYGRNRHRRALLRGLRAALDALGAAGCHRAYVDGSFVSAAERPADFDGCWEVTGVDVDRLDPVLLDFAHRRAAQKSKYGGELFSAEVEADPFGRRFLEFFQRDKNSGRPKGIIAMELGGLR